MNFSLSCVLALFLPLSALPLMAQTAPPVRATPTPADLSSPQGLLDAADAANSLDALSTRWRLKASYETSGPNGALLEIGTFEEWHLGVNHWKRTYASDHFKQTEYRTPEGIVYETDAGAPQWPESLIADQLIHPTPPKEDTLDLVPELRHVDEKASKLTCVMLSSPSKKTKWPLGLFPTYCFDPASPMLRLEVFDGSIQATRNHMASFQGIFVSKDIMLADDGKSFLRIRLTDLASLSDKEAAAMVFPTITAPQPLDNITVPHDAMSVRKTGGPTPVYPVEAKRNRLQGEVVLAARIGSEGRIHSLRVLSSPGDLLSISAVQAVQRWTYRPITDRGQPIAVRTELHVVYKLGS